MQTFLPFADFNKSAHCLDVRRLGKQRLECQALLESLIYGGRWSNHPACSMWKGFTSYLFKYAISINNEWAARGYRSGISRDKLYALRSDAGVKEFLDKESSNNIGMPSMPWWIGFDKFHLSHQSNLLRKNPVWYGKQGFDITDSTLPYYWPKC